MFNSVNIHRIQVPGGCILGHVIRNRGRLRASTLVPVCNCVRLSPVSIKERCRFHPTFQSRRWFFHSVNTFHQLQVKPVNKVFDKCAVFSKSSACGNDHKLHDVFFDSLVALVQSSELCFSYSFVVNRGKCSLNSLFKLIKSAKISSFQVRSCLSLFPASCDSSVHRQEHK
jgi:hypothetical protein